MLEMSLQEAENLTGSLITGTNRRVYEDSHWNTSPRCIYFYYVTFTRLGRADVKVYYYDHKAPFAGADLVNEITKLTINARKNEDVPPKCGTIFEAVNWQRKSYFVLLVDDEIYSVADGNAIVFSEENGKTPNHTFLDGDDLAITVPNLSGGTDTLQALCCINHMKKNANGDELDPDERQYFIYYIYLDKRGSALIRAIEKIDPGGTNLGPAVGPP